MWLVFIPFLTTRIYQIYKSKSLQIPNSSQELIITSLFALFSRHLPLFLWIPLYLLLYLRWYSLAFYQINILTALVLFLESPRCFVDSIKTLSIYRPLIFGVLFSVVSFFGLLLPESRSFLLPLFFVSLPFSFPKKRKKQNPLPEFSFPNEQSYQISPVYPALRKTISFLGEKRFQIPIPQEKKPHIIFLFLESFRAKNVGCLDAEIPASPHFDAWAKKGILFRNFHANGLQSFRSFFSAYFGIPAHMRSFSLKPFCTMSLKGLPQILKNHGYHPAIIQSGNLTYDSFYPFFKKHGFETIIGAEDIPAYKTSSWGVDDEAMFKVASSWLEKQTTPTFLSLFTVSNHHPWKSPSNWNYPVPTTIPLIYQNFLKTFAYTDHCLNYFLEELKQKKILDQSVVFIMGDHGQEMFERRNFSELHHSLYEENIHVPLLILGGDKIKQPKAFDCNASFVDLLPTVLDMLNIQDSHHSLGNSLMRNISAPSYFSMYREDLQIGSIQNKKKVILSNHLVGFDLEKDKNEKTNITPNPSLEEQALQCKQYFLNVDTIMQKNAWALPNDQVFELKATPMMKNGDWIRYLQKHPLAPVIDLSSGIHLSDQALIETAKNHGTAWHKLTLRNCNLMTDTALIWICKYCDKLVSLDLSHCHLLTDAGITPLFYQNSLRYLWLDGIDLSHFVPEKQSFNFNTISLKNIRRLEPKSLFSLYANSKDLLNWSACITNVTNQDLLEMSRFKKQTTHMALEDGIHIEDEALSTLIASQEEIQEIHLENFPKIKNPDFSKLTKLRYITIGSCPNLSDAFFKSLENLSLIRIIVNN